MRKSIKNGILSALELGGLLIVDLIVLSRRPYSRDAKIINKRIEEIINSSLSSLSGKNKEKSLKNVIYKLKRDGLIDMTTTGEGKYIAITQKGKNILRKAQQNILPATRYSEKTNLLIDKVLKIIIFDIPETERRKRNWLRSVITNLGFKQLQKSVWVGNNPIPKELLRDLKELEILRFIEIFSVNKKGTIEKIIE